MTQRVLIVVPCYNEEDSLPVLLKEIGLTGFDAVILNDASCDSTQEIAEKSGFSTINLPLNLGIGGAVQSGFIYAVRNNYDIVVQIDGDGQHNPSQIQLLIQPILNGEADCVIGSRYLPFSPDFGYHTPLARRIGMYFSTSILSLIGGLHVHDTTSGFRALNRKAFSYFSKKYPVDHPEAEALLMLHQIGLKVIEVPVSMRPRLAGQSLFTLLKSIMYPLRVMIGFWGLVNKKP